MTAGGPAGAVIVTGTGVLCATASGTRAFAAALREGRSGIGVRDPAGADDGLRPVLAADLPAFDLGDAVGARAGLPGALRAAALRAAHRAPLPVQASVAVALEAWEQAGLADAPVPPERVGVVVAGHNLTSRYADEVRPRFEASPVHLPARFPLHALDTDHVGTVSEILGATGEGYTIGGASASGNVAIVDAARLVAAGAVDACVVVGALTDLSDMERQGVHNLGAAARMRDGCRPEECCRPFDEDRSGFVPGQGAACLVLEAAASAERRGVGAIARVAGAAAALDGNRLADPSVGGEVRVMRTAIERAGAQAAGIGYVNAHATGSRLGDETEAAALREVFGGVDAQPWLNSTKGLVGHCLCAAGVVEAVATVVQLHEGFVHPNANLARPLTGGLRFVGPRAEPARCSLALSNAFGFGGFNASVVLARGDG